MSKADTEPKAANIGSGSLGVIVVRKEMTMGKIGFELEGACDLWSYILILFGVEWVMPRMVLELLISWGASVGYGRAKEA
jgi:hypothetical protein